MTRTRLSIAALCALTLTTLTGCGGSDTPVTGGDTGTSSATGASQDPELLTPYGEPVPTVAPGTGSDEGAVADLAAPSAAGGFAESGTDRKPDGFSNEALRAGYVDDNADFTAYEKYLDSYRGEARDLSVVGRQVVTVTDTEGLPLLGAVVTVGDDAVPSHVDGRALFFDTTAGEPVSVTYGDATASGTLDADGFTTIEVDAERVDPGDLKVDLDLVLDTTGSMGDEIDQLNTSLQAIAERLDALPSQPQVRYALTVYRDHGDAYVFRANDFGDLEEFSKELAETTADGGGDTPEALDEAFHAAVNGPAWGQDTASVELMLLVSDASSHLDDQKAASGYAADVAAARQRGIEVVPLAASGSDNPAEFEFRQLAQQTLGTFFFLTYGPDGSPGDGTTNHVSDYATGSLDDLVVGHVSARLAAYDAPAGEPPQPTQPTQPPTDPQQQPTR